MFVFEESLVEEVELFFRELEPTEEEELAIFDNEGLFFRSR